MTCLHLSAEGAQSSAAAASTELCRRGLQAHKRVSTSQVCCAELAGVLSPAASTGLLVTVRVRSLT